MSTTKVRPLEFKDITFNDINHQRLYEQAHRSQERCLREIAFTNADLINPLNSERKTALMEKKASLFHDLSIIEKQMIDIARNSPKFVNFGDVSAFNYVNGTDYEIDLIGTTPAPTAQTTVPTTAPTTAQTTTGVMPTPRFLDLSSTLKHPLSSYIPQTNDREEGWIQATIFYHLDDIEIAKKAEQKLNDLQSKYTTIDFHELSKYLYETWPNLRQNQIKVIQEIKQEK